MLLTCVSEAENFVSDLDIKVFLESPNFDRKYLNALVSEFLAFKFKTNVAYPWSWPKQWFATELTPPKSYCESIYAALLGFLFSTQ